MSYRTVYRHSVKVKFTVVKLLLFAFYLLTLDLYLFNAILFFLIAKTNEKSLNLFFEASYKYKLSSNMLPNIHKSFRA